MVALPQKIKRITHATQTMLCSAITDPVVILNYHRINKPTHPANNLTVSTENFREQIRVVRDEFAPTRLQDLAQGRKAYLRSKLKTRRKRVVVTFDDGYADTCLNALPILEEFGVPATVFVTTGSIGTTKEFWWDELDELLLERLPQEKLGEFLERIKKILPKKTSLDPTAMDREQLYRDLAAILKGKGDEAVKFVLGTLHELLGIAPLERDPHRACTLDELKRIANHPLIEIGSHTVTHPSLGRVENDRQFHELLESKKYLENTLNLKVTSIAYPFGQPEDFNGITVEVAKRLGYKLGVTTVSGVASAVSKAHTLPRMFVQNWNGPEFERRLRRLCWVG